MKIPMPVAAIVAGCFALAGLVVGASSFEQAGRVWTGSSAITWPLLSVMFIVPILSIVLAGEWLINKLVNPVGKSTATGIVASLTVLILVGVIQFARQQGMFTMPAPCAEVFTLRPVTVIGAGVIATCFPAWTMLRGIWHKVVLL